MVGMLPLLMVLGLDVPWKCGVTFPVTQGHNTGSHTGLSAWAWDFGMPVGAEVWAAAPGTVTHIRMDSTVGGCDSAYVNEANYVTIDHGDGTTAVYVHLETNSSPLAPGDPVAAGDLVGRVGLTGWVCGAHLHFQVQETCGGYYCQSIPATFEDYGDPSLGTQVESTNCPPCLAALEGGTTQISDLDSGCFARETAWWWSSPHGLGGHHFYTFASDAAAPETIGTWHFDVVTPGAYLVEVFIPDEDAQSQGAMYAIHHEGGIAQIPVDQTTDKGWHALGVFTFAGGEGERIALADNTGESVELGRRLAYDEVRLVFVPPEDETTGGEPEDGDSTSSSSDSGGGTAGPGPGMGDDGSTGPQDALPDTAGADDSGCACTTRDTTTPPVGVLVLLVLAARHRRRLP